jgi:hypothetical protein
MIFNSEEQATATNLSDLESANAIIGFLTS